MLLGMVFINLVPFRDHLFTDTGKMSCKYGPVFAPYLHDWTLYGTVQKRVCIYMAFFLCDMPLVI